MWLIISRVTPHVFFYLAVHSVSSRGGPTQHYQSKVATAVAVQPLEQAAETSAALCRYILQHNVAPLSPIFKLKMHTNKHNMDLSGNT